MKPRAFQRLRIEEVDPNGVENILSRQQSVPGKDSVGGWQGYDEPSHAYRRSAVSAIAQLMEGMHIRRGRDTKTRTMFAQQQVRDISDGARTRERFKQDTTREWYAQRQTTKTVD